MYTLRVRLYKDATSAAVDISAKTVDVALFEFGTRKVTGFERTYIAFLGSSDLALTIRETIRALHYTLSSFMHGIYKYYKYRRAIIALKELEDAFVAKGYEVEIITTPEEGTSK